MNITHSKIPDKNVDAAVDTTVPYPTTVEVKDSEKSAYCGCPDCIGLKSEVHASDILGGYTDSDIKGEDTGEVEVDESVEFQSIPWTFLGALEGDDTVFNMCVALHRFILHPSIDDLLVLAGLVFHNYIKTPWNTCIISMVQNFNLVAELDIGKTNTLIQNTEDLCRALLQLQTNKTDLKYSYHMLICILKCYVNISNADMFTYDVKDAVPFSSSES